MIEALIFDCDGVLINSEAIHARVTAALLAEAGMPITAERLHHRFVGETFATILPALEAEHGRSLPPDFAEIARVRTAEAYAAELRPIDGAARAIAQWTGPRAVASNSRVAYLRRWLGHVGLWPLVEPHVYSAEHVARPKPAPDVYLRAAEGLGVDPGRCVVVEDSAIGARAARAAGMRVIGFTGASLGPPDHDGRLFGAGAIRVIAHLDDLGAALADLP